MSQKNQIPNKNLLQEIADDILDMDATRAISAVVSKEGENNICLDPSEPEELVGNICFIANHEENNPKLVKQFDELSDYLEKYLDE